MLTIHGIIWIDEIVDKIAYKHNVRVDEVEEVLRNKPQKKEVLILSARDMAHKERGLYGKKKK